VSDKVLTHVDFESLLPVEAGRVYHLRGVVEHQGASAGDGHYVAYVRACDNRWYHCNDSVSPRVVSFSEVRAAEAYVLVYEIA
jgi:ubiquitin C-terminal hydrolase